MSVETGLPWLSVIIPVHEGERWLAETLDSLVMQADGGLECLVIDSSPSTRTLNLVRRYEARLRLRIFSMPELAHWRSKTNYGFEIATAPWVSMLHQDDFWLRGRAAALRGWLSAEPDAVMHLHPAHFVDEVSRRLGLWRCPLPEGLVPAGLFLERLLVQNFIAVPTPVIRREAFLAVGGIDEALCYTGDWDLYLKLARLGPIHYHSSPLACFRIHSQSLTALTSRDAGAFERQLTEVLQTHLAALPQFRSGGVRRRAEASIRINAGLAAASNGNAAGFARAVAAMVALGPFETPAYLRDSRLLERVAPRLRARLSRRG